MFRFCFNFFLLGLELDHTFLHQVIEQICSNFKLVVFWGVLASKSLNLVG